MKTMRITDIMADFLDSIRAYERESGSAITYDERGSSEFVAMYFNGGGKINIKEKEPLFITKDGVECFDGDEYISIGSDFSKINMVAYNCDAPYSSDVIRFKNESNADEYIWKNRRVFSYEDMMKAKHSIILTREDIVKSAKERSKL